MYTSKQTYNSTFFGLFSLFCPIVVTLFIIFDTYNFAAIFAPSELGLIDDDSVGARTPLKALFAFSFCALLGMYFGFKSYKENQSLKSIGIWALFLNVLFSAALLIVWGLSIVSGSF
jgi:hypothetical protein